MPADKLVDSARLDGAMTETAGAIRAKTGDTDELTWDMDTGFKVAIEDIVTLVEGTANDTATADDILLGRTAHTQQGTPITGTIPTKTSSDLSFSGSTREVTVPSGYYASNASYIITAGQYTARATQDTAGKVKPSVGLDASSTQTFGFTTDQPSSGTTGTNYLTITPGIESKVAWQVTPKAIISQAGYVAENESGTAGDPLTGTPATEAGTKYYVPVVTPTFGGGTFTTNTNTNTVTKAPQVEVKSSGTFKTATSFGVTSTKPSGTDGTNYLTINGGGTPTNGTALSTVNVTRNTVTYTNSPGVIASHSSEQALASDTTGDITKAVPITPTVKDSFAAIYIPVTQVIRSQTTLTGTTVVQERGQASWAAGAIQAGSIGPASFSNEATSGVSYVDITDTDHAPILVSGGSLYINEGYVDNLEINIRKLVPDSVANAQYMATADKIVQGYGAFNADGVGVAGSIPPRSSSDLTASLTTDGQKVTAPAGYYENAASHTTPYSEYHAEAEQTVAGTVTPSVSFTSSATTNYGFTNTKPSGTDGTNYLTINPGGSVSTKWKVTPKAFVTTAGYSVLNTSGTAGTALQGSPTIAAGTNYYVPIVSPSFSGGVLTPTAYTKPSVSVSITEGSDDNVDNFRIGTKSTSTYPYYVQVSGSTPAIQDNTTVSMSEVVYTNAAGTIVAHNNQQAVEASSCNVGVNVAAGSGSTYVSFKKAAMTVAGENVVAPSVSLSGENVTLSTTDSGISVTATGGGTASVTATATTATAGYAPASTQLGSATLNAPSATTPQTRYITAVTVPSSKSFAVTNSGTTTVTSSSKTAGSLTVKAYATSSASSTTSADVVTNGVWKTTAVSAKGTYYGRVTVGEGTASSSFANTNLSTYFTSGTSSSNSISITPRHSIDTAGWLNTASNVAGTTAYYTIRTTTLSFAGGALTGKTASATGTNCTLSDTNLSGVSIQAKGTAGRAAVTYTNEDAGWLAAHTSATNASSAVTASTWNGETYYINGVTIAKPSSGERTFGVTVPNGSSTITFTFHVDSSGNVTVRET